jgi:hypothetical protein
MIEIINLFEWRREMYVVDRAMRFIASAIFGVLLVAVGTGVLHAQQPQTPQPPSVSTFMANPNQLLQQYPSGGSLMIAVVQQLALADPAAFNVLLGLVANANDPQKGALGEGLAQAAKIEVLTNQPLAAQWQQQIEAITDPAFKIAATNAFGDVRLGAIGGGPLGSAGGGPGGAGGGGGLENLSSVPVITQPFAFTGSTSGASVLIGITPGGSSSVSQ